MLLFPSSAAELAPGIPQSKKHLLYECSYAEREPSAKPINDPEYRSRGKRGVVVFSDFVHNVIFTARSMKIILVDPDPPDYLSDEVSSCTEHIKMQIEQTVSVLNPSQRLRLRQRWVDDLKNLTLKPWQNIAHSLGFLILRV